jgi:hypothetical protein
MMICLARNSEPFSFYTLIIIIHHKVKIVHFILLFNS